MCTPLANITAHYSFCPVPVFETNVSPASSPPTPAVLVTSGGPADPDDCMHRWPHVSVCSLCVSLSRQGRSAAPWISLLDDPSCVTQTLKYIYQHHPSSIRPSFFLSLKKKEHNWYPTISTRNLKLYFFHFHHPWAFSWLPSPINSTSSKLLKPTSSQDGGIGRHIAPPRTTKRTTTI